MSQEMLNALVPSPGSPLSTSPGIPGSLQCTKNSDESYAVCASISNTAIKYNLRPFSFAAKGPNQGSYMRSCDLFETSSQSTSRAVCVKGKDGTNSIVYFHRVSDMINITNVTIGVTGNYPHVIVDTPNQIAFVSNDSSIPAIYKIANIGSFTPTVAATLTSFGAGDMNPGAMLIINEFLYVHINMGPARLARINISTFTWNQTVTFASGESNGWDDNLANGDNFIYDLTKNGILVRCTYKNNNFARFDRLNVGLPTTRSLAISPDSTFLLLTADNSGIVVVNTSTFSVESRALLPNPTGYVIAQGRPIILSKNSNTNAYPVCAFSSSNDYLFTFNFSRVPFREVFPSIYPLPSSPISTSSGVVGSRQCTKNSDESYAVCASASNTAIKYNLQPFSFAAKGPDQGNFMTSCDLDETSSQSTSRAVCVKGSFVISIVIYFHRVSDMINITSVTTEVAGAYPQVMVDTPNQVAYFSSFNIPPVIQKITNIGSSTPIVAGNLTSFGSGDYNPVTMLIIDGFLYVHCSMNPARFARINISTFTWNQTVKFAIGENGGDYDNLANDDNFIYDLAWGSLVRCTYKNNNFARFDSLNTGLQNTWSLAISPDQRTMFVVSNGNSFLQMVDVSSFSMFGNSVMVPNAFGRPIVTSSRHVLAFGQTTDLVYAFRYTNPTNTQSDTGPPTSSVSAQLSASRSASLSTQPTMTRSGSNSASTISASATVSSTLTKTRFQKPDLTNHLLAVVTNVAQSVGMVAVATVSAVSPSLGFGVARQQAMVNFMQNIRDADCGGISDLNEVPAADSPTQIKIGSSDAKFYIGGAVGNTILSISLILAMQIGGTLALKFSGSSSWNRPFDVFARCNVALVGYVCASILLAPTLTFGLVSVSVSNVENLSVGSKVLAVIFSVVFVVPTFYYAIWSVFLRPNMKLEQYRKLPKKNTKVSFFIRTQNFLFEGEGEWMLHKKAKLNEKLNFDAATPMFEGYNGRAKWFGLIEFVVQVGLALAPFLSNLVSVEKSCVTTFSVLIFVLGGYLFLSVWLRPFQERFNRIVIPIVTLCQIAVVILAYVYAENPPDYVLSLAIVTVSLQNAMTVIVLFASFSPLMKHALRAYRKLKKWWSNRKQQKSNKNNTSHVLSLRYLMDGGENDEQELNLRDQHRRKKSKNREDSRKNKKYEPNSQNQHHTRNQRNSETRTSRFSHIPSAEPKRDNDYFRRSSNNNNRNKEKNSSLERHRFEHGDENKDSRRDAHHRKLSSNNNNNNHNNNNRRSESPTTWQSRDDREGRKIVSDYGKRGDLVLQARK